MLRKKTSSPPVICHDTDCALAITCHHMPQHATTTFHNTKLRDVDGCCKCVTPILSSAGREGSAGVKKAGESSFTRPLSNMRCYHGCHFSNLFILEPMTLTVSDLSFPHHLTFCTWHTSMPAPAHFGRRCGAGAGISGLIAAHSSAV